jgi:serine/threonine-protein kinase
MAASVILKIKNGKFEGKSYEFHEPHRCFIGRGEDCGIRLPNEPGFSTVSRHHCQLDIDPPTIRVQDCGSLNGTYVNGMPIGRPSHWHLPDRALSGPCFIYDLSNGDEVQVGETVFEVDVVASENSKPQEAAESAAEEGLRACS